jgi:GntR family transcriptional regulator
VVKRGGIYADRVSPRAVEVAERFVALAAEAGVNPLTVAKAYQTLQDDGHVIVKRGVGMFVAPGAVNALKVQERDVFLTRIWPRMRTLIERLDLDLADLMDTEPA